MLFVFLISLISAQEICPKLAFSPSNEVGSFTFPPLFYSYSGLEPNLWSQIVFLHYERHMQDSFARLAVSRSSAQAANSSISDLLQDLPPDSLIRQSALETTVTIILNRLGAFELLEFASEGGAV